jgi:hypothetical protein
MTQPHSPAELQMAVITGLVAFGLIITVFLVAIIWKVLKHKQTKTKQAYGERTNGRTTTRGKW